MNQDIAETLGFNTADGMTLSKSQLIDWDS
jgi:hypothetical protein